MIISQDKPNIYVLRTVSAIVVHAVGITVQSKTVNKTPTLGLSCEAIKEPRIIWSPVSCPDGIYVKLLLVANPNKIVRRNVPINYVLEGVIHYLIVPHAAGPGAAQNVMTVLA